MSRIYTPSGRALEYSYLALNHYSGCSHGCRYCYARLMMTRFGRKFDEAQSAAPDVLSLVKKDAAQYAGTNKRVLLCFTTDPYQPLDLETGMTRRVIEILKASDIPFQVLTKGGMRASRDFDLYGKYDAFASTLTFVSEKKSLQYEPGAALPKDRFKAIELAHIRGIETWASLEPVIDPHESLQIIHQTHGFVDLYKIGILNHLASVTDWRAFGIAAIDLCQKYGKKYYIKQDLAKHLQGVAYTSTDTRLVERLSQLF